MTVRYFCDVCTREVENSEAQREFNTQVILQNPPPGHTATRAVALKLIRAIDGAWNAGHLCNSCLRKALAAVIEQIPSAPFGGCR